MFEKVRIGINGAGTIGRELLSLFEGHPRLEVVAVNDVAPVESILSHLRRKPGWPLRQVDLDGDSNVRFGHSRFRLFQSSEPGAIAWASVGAELVIEASGRFTDARQASQHLHEGGAKRVIVTAPSRGADLTLVRGVTDGALKPEARVVSAGSCTTNCVAPLLFALDSAFGFERGGFVSIHAATNDQSLVGAPGHESARSFASLDNIFATATGASRAIEEVLPKLRGRLLARAVRVPVSCGSRIELWGALSSEVSDDRVLEILKTESSGRLHGLLAVSDERLASDDIRGARHSSIVEGPSVSVIGERYLMISAWYDNVCGFSQRVVEIADRMAEFVRDESRVSLAAAGC